MNPKLELAWKIGMRVMWACVYVMGFIMIFVLPFYKGWMAVLALKIIGYPFTGSFIVVMTITLYRIYIHWEEL